MLQRPLPRESRHVMGIAVVAALAMSGAYAAWASQSIGQDKDALILVDLKLTISNSKTKEVYSARTEYLVHSGELPAGMLSTRPIAGGCVPFLPGKDGTDPELAKRKALGLPVPTAGQILLDCKVQYDGRLVATPSLIAVDGQPAVVETSDTGDPRRYTFEIRASTSRDRIEAAQRMAHKR